MHSSTRRPTRFAQEAGPAAQEQHVPKVKVSKSWTSVFKI